jgi:ribonuclease R
MPSRRKKQPNSSRTSDPFASREAGNYANPIVSREYILEQLEQLGQPVNLQEFAAHLQMQSEEQIEALRRRLNAMARDGQIIKNRKQSYGLTAHMDLLPGKVQGNKDGSGYFIPDNNSGDLFLPLREMSRLFDGDRVLARASGSQSRGRSEADVVEVLQRRHEEIVGRFYREAGFAIVIPDSKRIQHEILIPDKSTGGAVDGQYVIARIREYPNNRRKTVAEVTEVLGDVATPGIEIDIALHSFDLPHTWSAEIEQAIAGIAPEVEQAETTARHDLRNVALVTIDGEDAKDFDDAVFATEKPGGGWKLTVAIADVSHYVRPGSELDEEAVERGTSVYFPGHVVPMLPEALSNGLCSLKPQTDRLAMVCEMDVTASGEVVNFEFSEAVIHSHARLTYNEVADMLQPPQNANQEKQRERLRSKQSPEVLDNLDALYSLFKKLSEAREQRGAMDFDTPETRIVFGEDRKIREIVPVSRNEAHRLIEECMLCANVAAATLFEKLEFPVLYRVHQGPNPDRLEGLREFLFEMGLSLGGGDEPSPADYQEVLQQIADRPDRHVLQVLLIRSMMQAVYQPENIGHFGLGFDAYTHFTSPIRRYPDLLVHRAIRYLIRNKSSQHLKRHPQQQSLAKEKIYPYAPVNLVQLGERCSDSERRADAASYSVVDWLKCEYMHDRVGEEFSGAITSVTSFGLFVELEGIYIEGLVHITELSNDYYHYDSVRHRLEGERHGMSYGLGDVVQVRLARVDLEEKKIDLQMLGVDKSRSKHSRRGKKTKQGNKSSGNNKPAKNARSKSGNKKKKSTKNPRHRSAEKKSAAGNKQKKKSKNKKKTGSKRTGSNSPQKQGAKPKSKRGRRGGQGRK